MKKMAGIDGGEWKNAEMSGGDFGDELFNFLGSFEEILPESVEINEEVKKKKGKKGKFEKKPAEKKEKDEEKPEEVEKSNDENENSAENKTMTREEWIAAKKKRRNEQMKKNRQLRKERLARRKLRESENGEAEKSQKEEPKIGEKRKAENSENGGKEIKKKKNEEKTPKTDLKAWQQFYFLPQQILDAISDLGFAEPTSIQAAVLPAAVRDRQDILGAAETGSGKTLAFGIPVICRLLEVLEEKDENEIKNEVKGPKALIVAPTRELVIQIMKHIDALVKHTKFKAISIVGGLAQVKQERIISKKNPDIVVATPGRLWSMIQNAKDGEYFKNFKQLSCLVVDETDRMVEEGYFEELTHILNKIHEEANREKLQSLVFSATLTFARAQNVDEEEKKKNRVLTSQQKIQRLVKLTGLRENKHKIIDLTREMGTAGCLVEARINCSNLLEKDTALVYLLTRYPGRTIVFVNSVDAARRLHGILTQVRLRPTILHAKMIQKHRLRNLEKFSESKNAILLATDVAARGLDIQGIDHVIHYQVPKKVELYIHRSGRTARASHRGLTVLLVDSQSRQLYQKLCRGLNREKDLDIFPIDSPPLLAAIKSRVQLASEIDTLNYRCKKVNLSETLFEKMARDADLEYDETRIREMDGSNGEVDKMTREMWKLQAKLREELAIELPNPDGSNTIKTRYITPEIVSKINLTGDNAIDVLNKQLVEIKEWKKRTRKAQKRNEISKESRALKNKQKSRRRFEERKNGEKVAEKNE